MPTTTLIENSPRRRSKRCIGNTKRVRQSKFTKHQFNCFDGEGYNIDGRHEYVYLACFNGERVAGIRNENGLGSEQCFRFLIEHTLRNPDAINVIYGGSYDANMMMRDLPLKNLQEIRTHSYTFWHDWRIEYVPWKFFQVTYRKKHVSCRLWDVIGFFQSSFVKSIDGWLGINSTVINKGKAKRSKFTADDLDNIIAYCHEELRYFEMLMQHLWECLNAAGIPISRWDGAGSIAQRLMTMYGIYEYKGTAKRQDAHYFLARCAYAGGRFELLQPGDFDQKVYGYDINSAYPYAISMLPTFTGLRKCKAKDHSLCEIGEYDLLRVRYSGNVTNPIHPYFHRGTNLEIAYPAKSEGWHWAPEYLAAVPYGAGVVVDHLVWKDNGHRPFAWVAEKYNERLAMKQAKDPREKVWKLGLNSLYGKLAQQRGWRPGKPVPRFHQLYWAGWVTAKCRSMVYAAMMQNPDAIIAVETDGIISTEPLDLPLGEGLGEWDYKEYDWITYVQSGLYFARLSEGFRKKTDPDEIKVRSRGLNAESVSRAAVLKGWQTYNNKRTDPYSRIATKTKRFRTLATSLATGRIDEWRQWEVMKKEIALVPTKTGKRGHLEPLCKGKHCQWGPGHSHKTLARSMRNPMSEPYAVLWDTDQSEMLEEFYLAREISREEAIINE